MVTYRKFQSIRQVANRLFILSNQRGSLCECILTSLAIFGLAAQGMCLSLLAQPLPEVSKCDLAAER
jgi:hypothetical protein